MLLTGASVMGSEEVSADEKTPSVFNVASEKSTDNFAVPQNDLNTHNLFIRMMLMLVIVVILAIAVIYTQKKLMPKFTNQTGKKIKVLETVHLGRGKTLHLLTVGGKEILVGSTAEHITKIADIVGGFEAINLNPENLDNI